ncbi:LamG-like jellyroll fold domain-containing protein, partial [Arthrobacter oryzae]
MGTLLTEGRRALALAVSLAMALGFTILPVTAATADTAPLDPTNPASPPTVSADALPTVQVDGVVWQQHVLGNVVYAVGNFTTARPAGAAPGTNTVARSHILAYDITTGKLITTFTASLNAQAKTITASPDGSRLYIGGAFTQVNGVSRAYVAALNPTTGALITSFAPNVNSRVYAVAATNSAVYMGGWFSGVGSASRPHLAAVRASDAALLDWSPDVQGGDVNNMVLNPDGTKVVVGGNFTSVNGSSNPGMGMAALNTSTGQLLPWGINNKVRNGGTNSSIYSLASDGTHVYGTGYKFGSSGNLEGSFSASWDGGEVNWIQDCHGDTYGVYPSATAVYTVGHAHYCGNIGGFPQTSPVWTFNRAIAFSKAAVGTITADPLGYFNWAGNPRPALLTWFPDVDAGSFTGQTQGAWTITGNSKYVVLGGEFPAVNGTAQQGLVRFATKDIAPNKEGPRVAGRDMNPKVTALAGGKVRVAWQANFDRDNENLTYKVFRNDNLTTPVYTTTKASTFWNRPVITFQDSGLPLGTTQSYRIAAIDPLGNETRSEGVNVTVSAAGSLGTYGTGVLADGAESYWRLGEASGTTLTDFAGWSDAVAGTGVTRGVTGAINGDANTATSFSGSSTGTASSQTSVQGPNVFSVESWIKTTTTRGGKILGFGNKATGVSSSYDRQIYMDNAGRIVFGVYDGGVKTLTANGKYNDDQWHHIVATVGPSGMNLYVDGKRSAQRTDATKGQDYSGFWRIGGDNLNSWPSAPSSRYFNGTIDEVAIYPSVLSLSRVQRHFQDSGRTLNIPVAPADNVGKAVFEAEPDFYWRFGETSGSVAADTSTSDNPGEYRSGVTLGHPAGIDGTTDTSAEFDGVSGLVSSTNQFTNPTVYSQELWFNTTTSNGGKLIGFGDKATGLSSNYDRHVYMETSGALTFGVWTGQTNTITSSGSYNDGVWHHLVATQSSEGMKLFVDGEPVGTNPQSQNQSYSGYWRVGGDRTWGPQPYFAGKIDEVAVYPVALPAATVAEHFALGAPDRASNERPVAAFTSSAADLVASFDAAGSSDADGSVVSYAWDFGDGSPAGSGVVW